MVREIPLTRGYVALVDDEDFERASAFTWLAHGDDHVVTAARRSESDYTEFVFLNRWLLNCPDNMEVAFLNLNRLDFRRGNLRLVTRSARGGNNRKQKNNGSGYKGVSFRSNRGTWLAKITCGGQTKYLGNYDTPELAAEAYDDAARVLFGELARLNFPDADERAA